MIRNEAGIDKPDMVYFDRKGKVRPGFSKAELEAEEVSRELKARSVHRIGPGGTFRTVFTSDRPKRQY